MTEKQNDIFTIGVLVGALLIFAVVNLFAQVGLFSAKYQEESSKAPEFTAESYVSGAFALKYEEYLKDCFRNRAKWQTLWGNLRMLAGMKDVGGVYLGREDTYLMQRPSEDVTERMEQRALDALAALTGESGAMAMLIPTSDSVWADRLPAYADSYDQKAFLDKAEERIGKESWVDVCGALTEHAGEEIYYRTDPHWTSLGAYYGYLSWWRHSGKLLPYYFEPDAAVTVTEEFRGELSSMSGLKIRGEAMKVFSETMRQHPVLLYDTGERAKGYYREEFLESEDPYRYFLGEDTGFVEIRTGYERPSSLLVIRDSYANSLIPLLAPHYQKIYLADPRFYEGGTEEILNRFGQEEDLEILVLCSVPGWLEIFRESAL